MSHFSELAPGQKVENEDENALSYPMVLLNLREVKGLLPDRQLKLKRGFILRLTTNLDTPCGHGNSTPYVVEGMNWSVLYLSLAIGSRKKQKLSLPRISYSPGDNSYPVPRFVRTQSLCVYALQ